MPVGAAALALVRRRVPESVGQRASLDLVGTVLISVGLTAVVLPLVVGRQQGWPAWTWLSLAAAPVLLARVRGPPARQGPTRRGTAGAARAAAGPDLRRRHAERAGVLAASPQRSSSSLALSLQDGRGLSPLISGLVFGAARTGYFAAMLTAERIALVQLLPRAA